MGEKKTPNHFCVCNLWVAKHDPRMVESAGRRYHAGCLKRERRLNPPADHSQHDQLAFKFVN